MPSIREIPTKLLLHRITVIYVSSNGESLESRNFPIWIHIQTFKLNGFPVQMDVIALQICSQFNRLSFSTLCRMVWAFARPPFQMNLHKKFYSEQYLVSLLFACQIKHASRAVFMTVWPSSVLLYIKYAQLVV